MAEGQPSKVQKMLEKLQILDNEVEQNQSLDRILNYLTSADNEETVEEAIETAAEGGMLDDLYSILTNTKGETQSKVIQILAELAKVEALRVPCVNLGFVPILLPILESEDIAIATQACRTLGNICFENDEGRNAVDSFDGMAKLLSLLKSKIKSEEEGADRLRTIACGFLLNLTNTHESLQERALEEGVLDMLEQYISYHLSDRSLCNMVLLTVSSFADSEVSRDRLVKSTLCNTIVNLLQSDNDGAHTDTILDMLINMSEWDEIKDLLAETNLSNHLIRIIQSKTGKLDTESQQTIKMASDLLVLLLTGDKSMEALFKNSEGPVFYEIVKWLDSDVDHLRLSGALAVGNFARNDDHCRKLVEEGVLDKLLSVLKNSDEEQITLRHAILSALRNLAIPVSNKQLLVQCGVLEAVMILTSSNVMAVVFKLLGVLRMLVDGQESVALQLGNNRDFLNKLVKWCECDEHAGVQGEASRMLAWLIKNGRSTELMRNIVREDGVLPLVTMVASEHIVMQNEALMALTLIASTILADAALQLKEAELAETIINLLGNPDVIPEILCNTLTLTKTVCEAATPPFSQLIPCGGLFMCSGSLSDMQKNLKDEIMNSGLTNIVKSLKEHKDEKVRESASKVLTVIEEMPLER
ncbi:rap1 GTPase-GDP dissociation stimulator 1-B-like isoform X1 [Mytilus galloprovincialis]|uniref:rap1 GTPase-GDP dissociation stimulator 1-B-like isoform X1 n=1 Tax=Mytilus galloprovincialis TaxID=29158 RepID=UPI003F7C2D55